MVTLAAAVFGLVTFLKPTRFYAPAFEEIEVQVRVEPKPENRALVVASCTGAVHAYELHGDQEPATQPPFHFRMENEDCQLTAQVKGANNNVLAQAVTVIHVIQR